MNNNNTELEQINIVKKYASMKREIRNRFISLSLMIVVLILAVAAYLTTAWFAENHVVRGEGISVSADSPSASLFVSGNSDIDELHKTVDLTESGVGLYPISTIDCKNWYYVNEWTSITDTDGVSAVHQASGYAKVDSFNIVNNTYLYTNEEDIEHAAFYKQTFNLYTDRDELEVCLAPDNPISIDFDENLTEEQKTSASKILSALRIAITDKDDNLLVYYVPVVENGTGNSKNAIPDVYQGISGTEADNIETLDNVYLPSTIQTITAKVDEDDEKAFAKKETSLSFGNADSESGLVLNTYIWLEGTDAQTLKSITAGITDDLIVKFSFVGIE